MIKTCYFFCTIEGDLLIFSSICKLLKAYNRDIKAILILPTHNRITDNIINKYETQFDTLIRLPSASMSSNLFKGIKYNINYIKSLKEIALEKKSLVFVFDLYKMSEILFYTYVKKISKVKNNSIKIVTVTPYLSNPFSKNRAKILFFKTIVSSFYSIIFANMKLILRFRIKGTKLKGFLKFKQETDYQINIGKSKNRTISDNLIKNIAYPISVFDFNEVITFANNKPSIIVLVSTLQGNRDPKYWDGVKSLFNKLKERKDDFNILIKDHPAVDSKFFEYIKKDSSFFMLDSTISSEVFYLNKDLDIKYVFGYGSTAMLTASWLGIKCYDYTNILHFNDCMKDYYNDFLKLGNDIIFIKKLNQISNIQLNNYNINFEKRNNRVRDSWIGAFSKLGLLSNERN